ncbi:MAG: hypothetical protein KF887_03990 [Paracoccaceae bacterium]|nr:MAG: hypothetical protein KF887_03990 [Paracoccaceae bacterium]
MTDAPPPRKRMPPEVKAEYFAYRAAYDSRPVATGPFVTIGDVVARIRDAADAERGFSLVRMGDGDGCALFHGTPGFERLGDFIWAVQMSNYFGRRDWTAGQMHHLAAEVARAVEAADVVTAARSPALHARLIAAPEPHRVPDIRGWVGATWVQHAFTAAGRHARQAVYPDTWVHVALLPHLAGLLAGREIGIVSCRGSGFHARLATACNARLAAEVHIPGAAESGDLAGEPLYPDALPRVRAQTLAAARPGLVMLIAAGSCAKPLCVDAAAAGAVALDLGSTMDVLAGRAVRGYQGAAMLDRWRV